ncbi:MAG: hypothetical protein HW390_396 [Candidatus Brocadiaceae bacterium]|nr:hypothetical protein [Candidatus Brocadiaceae bacterium]
MDVDPQAVEVTKLSLLLKVLEGESEQTTTYPCILVIGNVKPPTAFVAAKTKTLEYEGLEGYVKEKPIPVQPGKSCLHYFSRKNKKSLYSFSFLYIFAVKGS